MKLDILRQIQMRLEFEAFDYAFRTLRGPRILRQWGCRSGVHRSWIRGRLPVSADHTGRCYRSDGSEYHFRYPVRISVSLSPRP